MKQANFLAVEDILDRIYFNYRYFQYITVSKNTKRKHNISGWICIVGLLNNNEIQLYDVFTGQDNEYLESILKTLFLAGLKLDVIIKIPNFSEI